MKSFTVVLTSDYEDGGYTVTVPTLPGCITNGETIDEALERARDAISVHLHGEDDSRSIERADCPQVIVAQVSVN